MYLFHLTQAGVSSDPFGGLNVSSSLDQIMPTLPAPAATTTFGQHLVRNDKLLSSNSNVTTARVIKTEEEHSYYSQAPSLPQTSAVPIAVVVNNKAAAGSDGDSIPDSPMSLNDGKMKCEDMLLSSREISVANSDHENCFSTRALIIFLDDDDDNVKNIDNLYALLIFFLPPLRCYYRYGV